MIPGPLKRLYRALRPTRKLQKPDWLAPDWHRTFAPKVATEKPGWRFSSQTQEFTWTWLTNGQFLQSIELLVLQAARQGLDVRLPFLDRRLVDFVLGLPFHCRIPDKGMKTLLRLAMGGIVPEAILARKKVTTFESALRQQFAFEKGRLQRTFSDGQWICERWISRSGARDILQRISDEPIGDCSVKWLCTALDIFQLELWLRQLKCRGILPKGA